MAEATTSVIRPEMAGSRMMSRQRAYDDAAQRSGTRATLHQLMALFGWKTEKMALIYMRKMDRKRLASAEAPLLLLPTPTEHENPPHLASSAGASEN